MRNPVCKHCRYKRAFCWFFRCDVYYEAQLKRTERRFYRNYLEDFNAEDRYVASLIVGWVVIAVLVLTMFMALIRTMGEVWR